LIHLFFGYKEDWRVIPLEDCRQHFWAIIGGEAQGGSVRFAETKEKFYSDGNYYVNEIYTQRFLPKWVYRAPDFTMICCDTNTDGNKFLSIFDNAKEIPLEQPH
jgi:hypothetical protein